MKPVVHVPDARPGLSAKKLAREAAEQAVEKEESKPAKKKVVKRG